MPTPNMAGLASGLRFHQVMGDNMEPTITRRDYVLVAPVDRYVGEGYYLLADDLTGEPSSIFSCSEGGTHQEPKIRLHSHLVFYTDQFVSKTYFEEHVLAAVVMTCHVVRPDLLGAAARKAETILDS